jgi:hypothetical protein
MRGSEPGNKRIAPHQLKNGCKRAATERLAARLRGAWPRDGAKPPGLHYAVAIDN